jgi:hypothetical protein
MEVQLWGKTVVLFPAQAKLLRVEEVMELTVLHPVLRPLEQLAVLLQGAAGEVVAQELPLVNQETEADQVDTPGPPAVEQQVLQVVVAVDIPAVQAVYKPAIRVLQEEEDQDM